jgi:signal transduction histidine kinase
MDEDIESTGLGFFGKVTASISHELKNRMAIINEQAGLLEDLVLMAERGAEIDLARLKRLSGAVKTQVAMGDRILRNMNRFAHSVDTPQCSVDIRSLLDLTTALAARPASLKGVNLEFYPGPEKVEVTTSPFLVMNLVWLLIEASLSRSEPGSELALTCGADKEAVFIGIGNGPAGESTSDFSAGSKAQSLASALGAEIVAGGQHRGMRIRLPQVCPRGDDGSKAMK